MTSKTSRSSFTRDLHIIPSLLLRVVPHFRFAVVPNFPAASSLVPLSIGCVQSGLPHGGFAYVLDAQTCQQIGDTLVDCTAHSSLCCECAVPNIAASMAYSAFVPIFLRERKSGGAGGAFAQKKEIFSFFILYLAAFQLLNLLFGGKT